MGIPKGTWIVLLADYPFSWKGNYFKLKKDCLENELDIKIEVSGREQIIEDGDYAILWDWG